MCIGQRKYVLCVLLFYRVLASWLGSWLTGKVTLMPTAKDWVRQMEKQTD